MRKYLQTVFDRLSKLKDGIGLNISAWAGQPDTPSSVQTEMDTLTAINSEINQLEAAREQKIAEARALAATKNGVADAIEKRAVAIHATDPGKLNEYGIATSSASGQPRPVPGKAVISSIADDDDDIGFKVRIQKLDHVDHFEVQRGHAQTPAELAMGIALAPPYPFLRTTKKLIFVDDDVDAGTRYFYRVRGVNNSGPGPWSDVSSAVQ